MATLNNIYRELEKAQLACSAKIRLMFDDGFEKNKQQIRHVRREQSMYKSFQDRIIKFTGNILTEFEHECEEIIN